MQVITSKDNESMKKIKKLNEKKYRDEENCYIVECIKIIAEGHMDLSRKLDEALKFKKEREMTNLQLVQMQGEITRLKIKVNGQQ